MVIECLIKCYQADDKIGLLRSIELMRNWRHPNLVVMENLYKEKRNNAQRLVLSNTIGGSLEGYIKFKQDEDVLSNSDGSFTDFFTKIILDLCSVVDQLVKRKICPRNISRENLYLRMENGEPQLKLLFDNVCRLDESSAKHLLTKLCSDINSICITDGTVHKGTEAFIKFLGNEAVHFVGKNLAATARYYPINWTNAQKAKYLIDLIPSSFDLRKAINKCGIVWPRGKDGGEMSEDLRDLKKAVDTENKKIKEHNDKIKEEEIKPLEEEKKIESEEKNAKSKEEKLAGIAAKIAQATRKLRAEILWNYDTRYGHDLVRLARNLWKHYDTYPLSIKRLLGNKEATLAALEKWCPGIWVLMYNAVGLGF